MLDTHTSNRRTHAYTDIPTHAQTHPHTSYRHKHTHTQTHTHTSRRHTHTSHRHRHTHTHAHTFFQLQSPLLSNRKCDTTWMVKQDGGNDGEILVLKESGTKKALPSCLTKTWHSGPSGQTFYTVQWVAQLRALMHSDS